MDSLFGFDATSQCSALLCKHDVLSLSRSTDLFLCEYCSEEKHCDVLFEAAVVDPAWTGDNIPSYDRYPVKVDVSPLGDSLFPSLAEAKECGYSLREKGVFCMAHYTVRHILWEILMHTRGARRLTRAELDEALKDNPDFADDLVVRLRGTCCFLRPDVPLAFFTYVQQLLKRGRSVELNVAPRKTVPVIFSDLQELTTGEAKYWQMLWKELRAQMALTGDLGGESEGCADATDRLAYFMSGSSFVQWRLDAADIQLCERLCSRKDAWDDTPTLKWRKVIGSIVRDYVRESACVCCNTETERVSKALLAHRGDTSRPVNFVFPH